MYNITVHGWNGSIYKYTATTSDNLEETVRREKNRSDTAAIFVSKKGKREKKVYQSRKPPRN